MKYFIILQFFIYTCFDLYGQWQLDTIRVSELKSDNVFIIADKENLIRIFGIPDFIDENIPFPCRRRHVHSTDKDTLFYFSTLTYHRNYDNRMSYVKQNGKVHVIENSMSYIEKDGRVRLTHFNFKVNKDAVIYIPKLKLSRKLRLCELLRAYNYTDENVGKMCRSIASTLIEKSRRAYNVAFYTGEHESVIIELLFDSKKKLREISIGAYDF
jgi:hypothetical protein